MALNWTEVTRGQRLPALEQGAKGQKQVCRSAERIEAPFIRRRRVRGEQVRQDPNPAEGDIVEDARPCKVSDRCSHTFSTQATGLGRRLRCLLSKETTTATNTHPREERISVYLQETPLTRPRAMVTTGKDTTQ